MNSAGQGRNRFAVSHLSTLFGVEDFSDLLPKPQISQILGFTLGVSVLTGLLFGLAPALEATRFDLIPALKSDAAGVAGRKRRWELRRLLVTLQVAMSLVLLVSGTLFTRSLRNL